jgi:hypothetical protein
MLSVMVKQSNIGRCRQTHKHIFLCMRVELVLGAGFQIPPRMSEELA